MVGGAAGQRHDHAPVAEIEVEIGQHHLRPRHPAVGQQGELDHPEAGGLGPPVVLGHGLVVGVAGWRRLQQQAVVIGDRRAHVDVPVGVPILHQATAEPDDLGRSQVALEGPLDVLPRQLRVAVGVEQALLGGDQPPSTIHADRAALEDERGLDHLGGEPGRQGGAGGHVTVPPLERPAPGVEPEVHPEPPVGTTGDEQRPVVTDPRVVEGYLDDLHPAAVA